MFHRLAIFYHPCFIGNEFDHDLECVDESFDHEYGTQTIEYMQCMRCGFEPDVTPYEYYGPGDEYTDYG